MPGTVRLKRCIVVIGASGFIGRRVVAALLARQDGAEVVAVSRSASRAFSDPRVSTRDMDLAAGGSLAPVIGSATVVVNCIAGPAALIIDGAARILDAAKNLTSPARVVHLSSLAAYGSQTGTVEETATLRGDLDDYSAAKASTDRLLGAYPRAVVLRPGIVYGPGSAWWSDRIARLIVAGRLGDLGAAGCGYCNLVYVEDVAAAVLRAIDLPGDDHGAFNLAWPSALTWNEYFLLYAQALAVAPRRISAGRLYFENRILAPPLKILEVILRSPRAARFNPWPPLRPWLTHLSRQAIRLDVGRAERDLGMRWTPLVTGLAATAAWFRAGGRTVN